MKGKYKFQVVQDAVMIIILLSLVGYHLWGDIVHEWLGIIFILTIFLHNGLNTHWFKKLLIAEYAVFRILQVVINLLLALLILSTIISGLMLSRHVLPDLPIHSSSDLVRKIHMTSVHWSLVIIAVHLGIHWKMLVNFFCQVGHISPHNIVVKYLMPSIFVAITAYGLFAFSDRGILPYLLMKIDFAFFDFEESKPFFYLDFFAVIISFAYLTHLLLRILKK